MNSSVKKLYLKIIDEKSGAPVSGVRVELLAEVETVQPLPKPTKAKRAAAKSANLEGITPGATVVLGDLTTNAMGLVAFSNRTIWRKDGPALRLSIRVAGEPDARPLEDGIAEIAALGPIRVPVDVGAMEEANLLDWADATAADDYAMWQDGGLNATDFMYQPNMFPGFEDLEFGGDACSRLIPNDQTLREFDRKAVIITERDAMSCSGAGKEMTLHRGEISDFSVVWKRLGYSFGDLIYSLALAPGEHVTLALSTWEQRQVASSQRDTQSQESYSGSYSRANSLTETMNASSKSFSFGASLGVSAKIPIKGIPISAALGMTTSVDRKSVMMNSSRNFADSIQQTAQRMRHDRQTLVIEQTETEDQSMSYRAVCNRNYCHVLNVFYHEVLENHRVTSYLMGSQAALLVPYEVKDFDAERAFCTHAELAPYIIDPCIDTCCEAFQRHLFSEEAEDGGAAPGEDRSGLANRLRLNVTIGKNGQKGGQGFALLLFFKNGTQREINTPHGSKWQNGSYHVDVSTSPFDPADVIEVGVKNKSSLGIFGSGKIDVNSYTVSFFDPAGSGPKALGSGSAGKLSRNATHRSPASYMAPPKPQAPIASGPTGPSPADDARCVAAYVAHLNCHKHYYNAILWMVEDVNARIARFETITCDNGNRLSDMVVPLPLGIYGNYVAFAQTDSDYIPNVDQEITDDRLVVLPTSGVFADVALGQCNACEDLPEDESDPFWKIIDKPNHCAGNTDVKTKTPEANSLFGPTGVGFAAPGATAWASAPAAPTAATANSLSAAFTAEVAKALLSSDADASLKDLAGLIEKLSKITGEIKPEPEPETEPEPAPESGPEDGVDSPPDGNTTPDPNAPQYA